MGRVSAFQTRNLKTRHEGPARDGRAVPFEKNHLTFLPTGHFLITGEIAGERLLSADDIVRDDTSQQAIITDA